MLLRPVPGGGLKICGQGPRSESGDFEENRCTSVEVWGGRKPCTASPHEAVECSGCGGC